MLSVNHVTAFSYYVAIPLIRPFSCSNQEKLLSLSLLRGRGMYIYFICLFSCSAPIQPMHTVRQPCTVKTFRCLFVSALPNFTIPCSFVSVLLNIHIPMYFQKLTARIHFSMQFYKCTAKTLQTMPQPTHNQSSSCRIPIT